MFARPNQTQAISCTECWRQTAGRWAGSCRRELLDRTLIWNVRHLMMVLRWYGDSCNSCRPHRALDQAAPLRALPDGITDPLVSGGWPPWM